MKSIDVLKEFDAIRVQKCLTLREAASWLAMSASHLSDVLSLRKRPSEKVITKMVRFILVEERRKKEAFIVRIVNDYNTLIKVRTKNNQANE